MSLLDPLRRRRTRQDELDEELQSHLAMDVRDRIARGERPDAAERGARREFGNIVSVAEVTREMWGGAPAERLWQDVKYGARTLVKNPGYLAVAVLSLALGIGGVTAAFSLADAVLFRPLAVQDPSSLVVIASRTPRSAVGNLSGPELLDLRRDARAFSGIVAARTARVAVARQNDPVPQMRFALAVTDGFFDVLGVNAAVGRTFLDSESTTRGREPVVVLAHAYWESQFGADPSVVGTVIRVNAQPFTVIGVLPPSFTGLNQFLRPALFVPLTALERAGEPGLFDTRDDAPLMARARLRPGASIAEAQAELDLLSAGFAREYPASYRGRTLAALSEIDARIAEAPPTVAIVGLLLTLATLVLLIACANVAGLQLARARARSREMAVRLAIGAGRLRLVRQLMTESLMVAVGGGALGVGAAIVAIRLLASLQLPTDTPLGLAVQLDLRVLAAAIAASMAAALVFGLAPAWKTAGASLMGALKSDDLMPDRRRLWGRNVMVAAQIATCGVLLVVSGTLIDAFGRMATADPGLRADVVMMLEFDPALAGRTPEETRAFYDRLMERVRQTPGVAAASLTSAIPFRPNFTEATIVPEGFRFRDGEEHVGVPLAVVDDQYLATMGATMVRGRTFTSRDDDSTPAVAIVNEELAARYWNGDAIGKRLFLDADRHPVEIVGIAKTAKYMSLMEAPQPQLYLAFAQQTRSRMVLVARAVADPIALTSPLLDAVRTVDPDQPVFNVRDFRTYYEQGALALPRTLMQMAGVAGFLGLGLALVGVYGLVSYTVSRRTREFGVRMAIGASRAAVVRLVLKQGLALSVSGALAGLALAIPVFLALSGAMTGLGRLSPWTLAVVPVGLVAVALAACWPPALRATRISATVALRAE